MSRTTTRPAREEDLPAINEIYNHFVLHSTCTYQEEPETLEDRSAWFDAHGIAHPVTVAEMDGRVVGWAALSPFHRRSAYQRTVEDAVYVAHTHHGRGIGKMLLTDLIARAGAAGHHAIIALIDGEQEPSVALHRSMGFVEAGVLREVGFKFGRWLHVRYMEFML